MATKSSTHKAVLYSGSLLEISPVYAYLIDVIVEPDNGQFYAHCPGVGGVHESGSTPQEALINAYYALLSILEASGSLPEGAHVQALHTPPDLLALPKVRRPRPKASTELHILLVPVPAKLAHGLA